jgi:hypothetical protein
LQLIGAIDLALVSSRHLYIFGWGNYELGEFFLAMVIVCFMISCVWVIFALMDALAENELLSKVVSTVQF